MGVIYKNNILYGGNALEYTGGTGITVSEDKVIATKDIKQNYIDNSNFRINQKGKTEYSTPDEYTVDRWYIDGGILTPIEKGVQFVNTNSESGAANLVRLRQNIGYSFSEFAGKTMTLSAKINDTIYTGTAVIPTEKPTEGTAVQYIAVGIPEFGINLNYSVTNDYFVPYIALAYNTTIIVEWMKLEINDEFSGYNEPNYSTELVKINLTTSNKGILNLPYTKDEVDNAVAAIIDDTSDSSETSTWSSKKIIEEAISQIEHSGYEKLSISTYANTVGNDMTKYIGYAPPSFMKSTNLNFYLLITDKRGCIKYKGEISINNINNLTVTWENEKNPSEIGLSLLSSSGGQIVAFNILVQAMATTPILADVKVGTSTNTISKQLLELEDLLNTVNIISNYDVYAKEIS